MTKQIIIEPNKQPAIEGQWTIGEILAAADFLRRWIEAQQVIIERPAVEDQP